MKLEIKKMELVVKRFGTKMIGKGNVFIASRLVIVKATALYNKIMYQTDKGIKIMVMEKKIRNVEIRKRG